MISAPFIWFGPSSRDDRVSLFAKNIDNDEHPGSGHSDEDKAIFATSLAVIEEFDRQRVAENVASLFKRDAMLPRICGRLAVISFKLFTDHYIRSTRRRSRCRGALRDGTRPSQASTATLATGCSWARTRSNTASSSNDGSGSTQPDRHDSGFGGTGPQFSRALNPPESLAQRLQVCRKASKAELN
jgi:hypothetical protein